MPDGSRILDLTYWHGVFWRNTGTWGYDLVRSDICLWPDVELRADLRCTPFSDGSFDCVVLDPPWGNGSTTPRTVGAKSYNMTVVKTPAAIRALYLAGLPEAYRLLRRWGILIVKCQNFVDGGKQHWIEMDVFNEALRIGLRGEDRFIVVPPAEPMIRHPDRPQQHSRKWGSTFWVFRKVKTRI